MVEDEGSDREKAFHEAIAAMMSAYEIIAAFLLALPIPIGLPLTGKTWKAAEALPAVYRARTLLGEEPIEGMVQGILDSVLLEWCNCYEMGGIIDLLGANPWRLEVMNVSLARMAVGLRIVEPRFNLEGEEE